MEPELIEEFLAQFPCGVIVTEGEKEIIVHLCGYPSFPTEHDVEHLKEELVLDPVLSLPFDENQQYTLHSVEGDNWARNVRAYMSDSAEEIRVDG